MIKIKKINRSLESWASEFIDNDPIKEIFSLIKLIINTVRAANIDDKDEYLNIRETAIHVNINRKPNWIDNAIITPKYVATPFPPLKFNHIGKTWPRKTVREHNIIKSGNKFIQIITGTYPFNASKIRVIPAKYLFPDLKTLVAPILPDPIFLISVLIKILVITRPKGIDPLK